MALPHEAESTLGVLAAGVLLADGDGVVVYANAAAGERLQRAASDLVGGSLASLLPHDPPLASSLERDGRAEVRGVELGAGATGLVDVLLSRWGEGGVAMVVLDAGARHAAAEEIERLQGELARSEQVRTRMDAVQRELVQPTGGPTSINLLDHLQHRRRRADD
ncbi:MAG: PAS domain-containing protein, partial [Planctomycetota bacterium]